MLLRAVLALSLSLSPTSTARRTYFFTSAVLAREKEREREREHFKKLPVSRGAICAAHKRASVIIRVTFGAFFEGGSAFWLGGRESSTEGVTGKSCLLMAPNKRIINRNIYFYK